MEGQYQCLKDRLKACGKVGDNQKGKFIFEKWSSVYSKG